MADIIKFDKRSDDTAFGKMIGNALKEAYDKEGMTVSEDLIKRTMDRIRLEEAGTPAGEDATTENEAGFGKAEAVTAEGSAREITAATENAQITDIKAVRNTGNKPGSRRIRRIAAGVAAALFVGVVGLSVLRSGLLSGKNAMNSTALDYKAESTTQNAAPEAAFDTAGMYGEAESAPVYDETEQPALMAQESKLFMGTASGGSSEDTQGAWATATDTEEMAIAEEDSADMSREAADAIDMIIGDAGGSDDTEDDAGSAYDSALDDTPEVGIVQNAEPMSQDADVEDAAVLKEGMRPEGTASVSEGKIQADGMSGAAGKGTVKDAGPEADEAADFDGKGKMPVFAHTPAYYSEIGDASIRAEIFEILSASGYEELVPEDGTDTGPDDDSDSGESSWLNENKEVAENALETEEYDENGGNAGSLIMQLVMEAETGRQIICIYDGYYTATMMHTDETQPLEPQPADADLQQIDEKEAADILKTLIEAAEPGVNF